MLREGRARDAWTLVRPAKIVRTPLAGVQRAALAFLPLLVLRHPLRARCASADRRSFQDSRQTLWGARRDEMVDAAGADADESLRTSPLFFKAALPKPVRATPSFLSKGPKSCTILRRVASCVPHLSERGACAGSGIYALSDQDCFVS